MRRREFIGGLATILPLLRRGAQAQVAAKPILIAILSTGSGADVRWDTLRESFRRGLQELRYTQGRHDVLEERFAAGAQFRALEIQNVTSHIRLSRRHMEASPAREGHRG
jgi:hypothetical protein